MTKKYRVFPYCVLTCGAVQYEVQERSRFGWRTFNSATCLSHENAEKLVKALNEATEATP
jgi:hypothetical protein